MKKITLLLLLVLTLGACSRSPGPQVPSQTAGTESGSPNIEGALQFFATNYPTLRAGRIDTKTIGVIWESGATNEFEVFRAKIKKDFGVESVITATE